MKTTISNINKTFIVLAAVVLSSFSTSPDVKKEKKDIDGAQLEYLGKTKNLPVFRLVIENPSLTIFTVIVKDDSGDVIYSESLQGNSIARTYKLDTDNTDLINGTSFHLTNTSNHLTTVFKVQQLTKNVEEINVTKVL